MPRERVHQLVNAVVREDGRVKEKLRVRHFISIYEEAVRHQRMPVVQLAELQCDSVSILEGSVKQQRWIKLQLQHVATEVLYILLDHDFDRLT